MGDFEKAALTALFAVVVYVIGQFIQKFLLEPIQEQRRLVGDVAFAIIYYANVSTPLTDEDITERKEARAAIRKLASQLRSSLLTIPAYGLLARFRIVPKKDAILKASTNLIGFSNSLGEVHSADQRKTVANALNIDW